MALGAYVGNFTASKTNADISYTGLGFQPKVVMFYGTECTTVGTFNSNNTLFIGVATGSTSQSVYGWTERGAAAVSNTVRGATDYFDNNCILLISGSDTIILAAKLKSLDADGFTLTWVSSSQNTYQIAYAALGSDDVGRTYHNKYQLIGTSVQQAVTSSFPPKAVFFVDAVMTVTPTSSVTYMTHSYGSFGFSKCATNEESAIGWVSLNTLGTMNCTSVITGSAYCAAAANEGATQTSRGGIGTTGSLGYTILERNTRPNDRLSAVALSGSFKVKYGTFTQNDASTNGTTQTITGVGFTPKFIVLLNTARTGGTEGPVAGIMSGFGMASGPSNQYCIGMSSRDNVADSVCWSMFDSKLIHSSGSTTYAASLSSFNSDGFVITWNTADGDSRSIPYLAFGDAVESAVASSLQEIWVSLFGY